MSYKSEVEQGSQVFWANYRTCATCTADRITVRDAFAIVNDEQDSCGSCRELAWYVVGADLDRVAGLS